MLALTESAASEDCHRAAGLLACQSSFPLCDCENGHSYFASREECEGISNVECAEERNQAIVLGIPWPNCSVLPSEETGMVKCLLSYIMSKHFIFGGACLLVCLCVH